MYKLVTKGEGGTKDELKRRMEVRQELLVTTLIMFCWLLLWLCFVDYYSDYVLFEVRKYFNLADKDGDGQITKAEWYKVLNDAGVPTTM